MTDDEPEMHFHEVNVPETRPALWMGGVPLEVASVLIVATAELVCMTWWYGVFIIPVWAITLYFIREDYNILRVLLADVRVTWLAMDSHTWHGSSVSAFPLGHYQHYHGTRRAARADHAWA